jgi:hypothetical protein
MNGAGGEATAGAGGETNTGGEGGAVNTPGWCDVAPLPAGIGDADHSCTDFEAGLPGDWSLDVVSPAEVSISQARAASVPNSLSSFVPLAEVFADRTRARLTWNNVGADAIDGVTIIAKINPSALPPLMPACTGAIRLFCVAFGFGEACLAITLESDHSFATEYTGLFVQWQFTGGPAVADVCDVTSDLDFALWNDVSLTAWRDGTIDVFINDVASSTGCGAVFSDDTAAQVALGLDTRNSTTASWTVYFDDLLAYTTRVP